MELSSSLFRGDPLNWNEPGVGMRQDDQQQQYPAYQQGVPQSNRPAQQQQQGTCRIICRNTICAWCANNFVRTKNNKFAVRVVSLSSFIFEPVWNYQTHGFCGVTHTKLIRRILPLSVSCCLPWCNEILSTVCRVHVRHAESGHRSARSRPQQSRLYVRSPVERAGHAWWAGPPGTLVRHRPVAVNSNTCTILCPHYVIYAPHTLVRSCDADTSV